METGTGKTYVYLRTIFELRRRYGFTKFIIAVPSVAVREGVKTSLDLMGDHFRSLYDNVPYDAWVYDADQISRLRGFAQSNVLQIAIMNVQAFDKAKNVMFKPTDQLGQREPVQFIRAAQPVVIVDEPQNFEGEKRVEALSTLNPLCTLRYSATHKNPYNLVHRLGPKAAYDLRLVKRIEVDSVLEDPDFNRPFISVESVEHRPKLKAKVLIDVLGKTGVKRKSVSLDKNGLDLFELSGKRDVYAGGYIVSAIDAGAKTVGFSNGVTIGVGESQGDHGEQVMRVEVRETIRRHLQKEQALAARLPKGRRMKVLSLFFIDKVANYREEDGKIRRWFEEEYRGLLATGRFPHAAGTTPDTACAAYFAQDKKGAKDTTGRTAADDDAYELIMKDKARLLSPDEPVRFVFSHSALREGWDNPNVFQICTLHETKSELRKRQEIGRGLRLPVMDDGERCWDEQINVLTVIANESYQEFAQKLQAEIQEETGEVIENGGVSNARKRKQLEVRPGWREKNSAFIELWERIKRRTRYAVKFETKELVKQAADALKSMPKIVAPQIRIDRAMLELTDEGLIETVTANEVVGASTNQNEIPDLLAYLQRETTLTRSTLVDILKVSGRLGDVFTNPQAFLEEASRAINLTRNLLIVDGIQYEPLEGDGAEAAWSMELFERPPPEQPDDDEAKIIGAGVPESYETKLVPTDKSVYDFVIVDSEVEREFAEAMQSRQDIKFFLKLPRWFRIRTPLGSYIPDWAIVLDRNGTERVYFVRETKSTVYEDQMRKREMPKVRCGRAHFEALKVDFAIATKASDVC